MAAGEIDRRNAAEDDHRTKMPVDRNTRNDRPSARSNARSNARNVALNSARNSVNSSRAMVVVGSSVRSDPITIEFKFSSSKNIV